MSAKVLRIFNSNGIPCIRIGLCDSENLHSDKSFVAGPNSPSLGEMVKSKVYYDILCEKMPENIADKAIMIFCPNGAVSQVIGNKRKNINELKEKYKLKSIKVKENTSLKEFDINIMEMEE